MIAFDTAVTTPPGKPDADSTPATAAPAAWPFAADGFVIAFATAAPAAGGIETEIVPPVDVVTVTLPVASDATTCAGGVVIVPDTLPVDETVTPAAFGAAFDPPAGAPVVAFGVDVLLLPGANVPPVVPELEPVFTPVLSEALPDGASAMLARKPVCFCADALAVTQRLARTANEAMRIVFNMKMFVA